MSLLGGIKVKISADIDGLMTGLDKARVGLSATGAKLRQGANHYGKYAAAGTAAASAIGVAMVKSQMKTIDALAKTADRLGLTTEALGGLHRAAELTGASTQTLDMALQRMTRRVSEAAVGTGEARAAIKELGLDAKKLAAMSPDQQFKAIAEEMKGVTEQGDRVRLAMKLFDSEGVKLVNTLDLGADGLDKTAEEARKLGVALNRVDASQVESANDAMSTAGSAIEGVVNKVAVQLAPVITEIANRFSGAAMESNGFAETVDAVMRHSLKAVGLFKNAMLGIELIVKGIQVAFKGMYSAIVFTFARMTQSMESFVNMGIEGLNFLIEKVNSIPGVAMDPIKQFTFGAATMFTEMSQIAGQELTNAMQEFHNLAMQPLPSEELEKWVAKVTESAKKVAAAKIEIAESGGSKETKVISGTEKEKQKITRDSFNNLASLMNTGSRKLFEIGKVAAISGAVMDGYEAVQGAYKVGAKMGGPVLGAAFAATAGIASAAQVQQIASTKFGSAGTGQSFSGGQVVNNEPQQTQPDRNISIALTGSSFSGGDIRSLIGAINDELGDGVTLNTTGG